jgi:HPt (histidine-containing phosphotransfer) domain-containing protein
MVYVGNDQTQCKEMINLFLETIPMELNKLKIAINKNDWIKAYEISHRIKPTMEILQIKNANKEFVEISTKIHQKIDLDSISDIFSKILENVNLAIEQIKIDYST